MAEGQYNVAMAALAEAESRLATVEAKVRELKATFEKQVAEKRRIEDGAHLLKRKSEQASNLIKALDGERERWSEDSAAFADVKRRLLGDCAVACAFISYCGPFNQPFRQYLVADKFTRAAKKRGVPVTQDLDVTAFLVDQGTVGDWNLQGLPTDALSIQNGILVTKSARYPLLVDPQGQALSWIKAKAEQEKKLPLFGSTTLGAKDLRDQLEFCMQEGLCLIVTGYEECHGTRASTSLLHLPPRCLFQCRGRSRPTSRPRPREAVHQEGQAQLRHRQRQADGSQRRCAYL